MPVHLHDHSAAAGLAMLVLGLGLMTVPRPRWRHALVFGLALVLALFTVESALHSVHHLGDAHADASCVVGVAGAHVCGLTTSPAVLDAPVATREIADDRGPAWPVPFQQIRPTEGRAPPRPVLG